MTGAVIDLAAVRRGRGLPAPARAAFAIGDRVRLRDGRVGVLINHLEAGLAVAWVRPHHVRVRLDELSAPPPVVPLPA